MYKHIVAMIVCVVWLIVEPLVMCGEMLTSDVGVRGLNRVVSIFTGAIKNSEPIYTDAESNVPVKNNKGTLYSIPQRLYQAVCKNNIEIKSFGRFWFYPYIDINGWFQRTLDKHYYSLGDKQYHTAGYCRSPNDFLVSCEKITYPTDLEIEILKEKIKSFKSFLEQNGVELLYVQHPLKNYEFYGREYPTGTTGITFEEYKVNEVLNFCKFENIDFIDLRKELFQSGRNWEESFYKSDHHWKVETGFWAFQVVAQRLKENYDFTFDEKLVQSSSYSWIPNYKNNCFLGSLSKRTGRYFTSSLESITKITPKFDTEYCVKFLTDNENSEYITEGNFDKVCLFENNLITEFPTTFKLHSMNPYEYYNGGNTSRHVLNTRTSSDKSILLIRDSYACTFSPFLYGICKECHEIDVRTYHQESLTDYVRRVKPDIVILMSSLILSPQMTFDEKSKITLQD